MAPGVRRQSLHRLPLTWRAIHPNRRTQGQSAAVWPLQSAAPLPISGYLIRPRQTKRRLELEVIQASESRAIQDVRGKTTAQRPHYLSA
jgi:hypothetical protein